MTEPTLLISKYCKAFEAWAECIQEAHRENNEKFEWAEHLPTILIAIRKSDLLHRLIYQGQEVRKNKCSKHKGEWSGLPHPKNDCGCSLTGWVPDTYAEGTAVNAWFETSVDSQKQDWFYWKKDWVTRSKETWPTKDEAVAAWKEYIK